MRDQVTSDAGIPLLTFIIEALNQDYKRYYPGDYRKRVPALHRQPAAERLGKAAEDWLRTRAAEAVSFGRLKGAVTRESSVSSSGIETA